MLIFLIFIILIILLLALIFLAFLIISIRRKQYHDFVDRHSLGLRKLIELNLEYQFFKVENFNLEKNYDNEHFFEIVQPVDLLIYELRFLKTRVKENIQYAKVNQKKHEIYLKRVENECLVFDFDTVIPFKNTQYLKQVLANAISKGVKKPVTEFFILVKIYRSLINGRLVSYKKDVFDSETIVELIGMIEEKRGDYYLNPEIWDSISKVERGRVSNKVRFAIYARDNYRCVKCGDTGDLEIDHIYPISKGGKSDLDNLQTLCHNCNYQKGNRI